MSACPGCGRCDCCGHRNPGHDVALFDRSKGCTCPEIWMAVIPPPPCPVHGQIQMLEVTC